MKLCIFQGTFNPIHNVHLKMAQYIKDHYKFDTILFIPAYKPPHKEIDDDLANHRYNMVKLAISGENAFHISNLEYQNQRYSYTYLTIKELYKKYKIDGKISFIIGTDAFINVPGWYEADKLKDLVEFIVFSRENDFEFDKMTTMEYMGYNFKFTPMPFTDLSSTVIRDRIKQGKSISTLVPLKVQEYIYENGIYKD